MLLAAVISRPHLCAKSTVGIVILAASSTLNAHPITARDFCRPQLLEGGGYSKSATSEAFSPPQQSEGAHRVQSPEAMAIEDNLVGPTNL